MRLGAVLAAGLLLVAAPVGAQERPNEPGEHDPGRSHGGKKFTIPVEVVVPLVALGVLLIGAAVRAEARKPPRTTEPSRTPPPPVEVRSGADSAPPRKAKPKTAKAAGGRNGSNARSAGGDAGAPRGAAQADDPAVVVPGEVLFEVKAGVSDLDVTAIARRARLDRISSERFELTGSTIYRYRIRGDRSVAAVVAALRADPQIEAVQPNHVYSLSQEATSELSRTQYAVVKLRLKEAHASATGLNVPVAIIDSGADGTHPALKDAIVESFDPVGPPASAHPHGTAIAGLIAARGDLASPAPAARILAIRAFSGAKRPAKPGAEGTTMHILRGLDWASKQGAKIVNMSFAGPKDDKISQFIAAGVAKGQIFVAAAGNAGASSPPLYPAADPEVIAVTAVDDADKLLAVANRGPHLAVAAPGVDVVVAAPGGGYSYMSGTSMAAAEVSGVIALMVQANPSLTAAEARAALVKSAVDLGAPGVDPEFGAGQTDAKAAVDAVSAAPSVSASPQATPVSAPVETTISPRP
ncbi:hypothetical protein GCM10008179_18250 [Hansschlegelia plantiphila]|uniref:Peptidase S8/S53 domain-containing protein n=2 Tax=Hansschlegelia plantiphila TaxID=374655 RepID=A0A9W6MVV0_9HYPH|nr:hypothetical protein GCM10008179_18250 [Hansschlegelia plantiphila]